MALNRFKFGELLELIAEKNTEGIYGLEDAIGVNINKIILPMRGNNSYKDFSKFKLVPPNHFAYNPRGSRKLGLGFNDTKKTYIITFNDNVFKIKNSASKIILNEYLFMYMSRKEFDRKAEFISWGSSTEVFDWNVFIEEEILLPSIKVQQKVVDVYLAMVENQKAYEKGLEDLKLTCDAYIENLRREMKSEKVGKYLSERIDRNSENITIVKGISKNGFIDPKQSSSEDLSKYKVVNPGDFVFSPPRINIGSIELWVEEFKCVCSPIYEVFYCSSDSLLNKYLLLWLKREEFYRYTGYNSIASVRNNFDFKMLCDIEIPIPNIDIQKAIVDIYDAYQLRLKTNNELLNRIKEMCPILIKGSISGMRKGD